MNADSAPDSQLEQGWAYALLKWPDAWPKRVEPLITHRIGNGRADVSATPEGCFQLSVIGADGKMRAGWRFQRIQFVGSGFAAIAFGWDQMEASLFINEQKVPLFDAANHAPVEIVLRPPEHHAQHEPVHISRAALERMTDQERHLLETLRDIEQKLESHTSYEIKRLAGLIRHLLIDGRPLAALVNREYRVQIKYRVMKRDETLPGSTPPAVLHHMTLSPDGAPSEEVGLEQFLRVPVLRSEETSYAVKDVIDGVAYLFHGVHSDEPQTAEERNFVALAKRLQVHDEAAPLYVMHDIARVVHTGLMPLVAEIARKYK